MLKQQPKTKQALRRERACQRSIERRDHAGYSKVTDYAWWQWFDRGHLRLTK